MGSDDSQWPLSLRIRGDCMTPLIADGDWVQSLPRQLYLPGDIVIYCNRHGQLVAHRLLGIYRSSGRWLAVTAADNSTEVDSRFRSAGILGRVTHADDTTLKITLGQRWQALRRFIRFIRLRIASRRQ